MYDGGVVAWAKAGHSFVNQFTGKFTPFELAALPQELIHQSGFTVVDMSDDRYISDGFTAHRFLH